MSIATMHAYADLLESARVGYSQGDRWSFNPARDGQTVVPSSDCDCSSSCAAIVRAGGWPLDTADPIWTGNIAAKVAAAGWGTIPVGGMSLSELVATSKPGDLIVGPGHVIYVRSASSWWSAESDERGGKSGGQPGDQTGREARFRAPYMRSRGWTTLLRPPADAESLVATTPLPTTTSARLDVDGQLGPLTIKAMQRWVGVTADGQIGPVTRRALQRKLGVTVDGIWGRKTISALQRLVGATVDGAWGPKTTRALQTYLNTL